MSQRSFWTERHKERPFTTAYKKVESLPAAQTPYRFENRSTQHEQALEKDRNAGIVILSAVNRLKFRKAFKMSASPPPSPTRPNHLPMTSRPEAESAPFWFEQMAGVKRAENEEDYDERVQVARWKPEQHLGWCRSEAQNSPSSKLKSRITSPEENSIGKVALAKRYRDTTQADKPRFTHLANFNKDPKALLKDALYRSMRHNILQNAKPRNKKEMDSVIQEKKKGWPVPFPKNLKENWRILHSWPPDEDTDDENVEVPMAATAPEEFKKSVKERRNRSRLGLYTQWDIE